jgi:magnesium transporter
MITQITSNLSNGHQFQWIDIGDPTPEDLKKLSIEFDIHETSLQDSLEPYHLPKYERHEDYVFIILRAVDPSRPADSSDINELTRKVAIFLGKEFLITVHRTDIQFIKSLREKWAKRLPTYRGDPKLHLCLDILSQGFNSFDPPIDEALGLLNSFEQESGVHLEKVYSLRKQSSTFKRLLRLSHDICVKLNADCDQQSRIYVQDLKEDLENTLFFSEDLNESIHHFINLQLSLQSQKTNETMRVMAIFSAFFMPITFIVGLYGMNFKFMPEIDWEYGYLFSLGLMLTSSSAIYFWFKKKKWL